MNTLNRIRAFARLAVASAAIALTLPAAAAEPPKAAPATPGPATVATSVTTVAPKPHRTIHHHHKRRALPRVAGRSHLAEPTRQVGAANAAARVQPETTGFVNAIQRYAFSDGALYQVYAKPGAVTDIVLETGEQLVGTGPVAAGDTVRWIIGDTVSGTGATAHIHILVKPVRADIATNLIINTNRRTYHLELNANPRVYMASVSWAYPEDGLIALRQAAAEAERVAPVAAGFDLARLNFGYAISGDKPAWRPLRAFDDGRQTFVEFAPSISTGEMPPLFVTGTDGAVELVNYRISGRYMVVDRLFERAELRLGSGKGAAHVAIARSRKPRS